MRYEELILRASRKGARSFGRGAQLSFHEAGELLARALSRVLGTEVRPEQVPLSLVVRFLREGYPSPLPPEDRAALFVEPKEGWGPALRAEEVGNVLRRALAQVAPFLQGAEAGEAPVFRLGLAGAKILQAMDRLEPGLRAEVDALTRRIARLPLTPGEAAALAQALAAERLRRSERLMGYIGTLAQEVAEHGPYVTLFYDPDFLALQDEDEARRAVELAKKLTAAAPWHGVYLVSRAKDGTPLLVSDHVPEGFRSVAEAEVTPWYGDKLHILVPADEEARRRTEELLGELPLGGQGLGVVWAPALKEANLVRAKAGSLWTHAERVEGEAQRHGYCGGVVATEGGLAGAGVALVAPGGLAYPSALRILALLAQARKHLGEGPRDYSEGEALLALRLGLDPRALAYLSDEERGALRRLGPDEAKRIEELLRSDRRAAWRYALSELLPEPALEALPLGLEHLGEILGKVEEAPPSTFLPFR